MKKKILIGAVLVVFLIMALPSIQATKLNLLKEADKSPISYENNKIDKTVFLLALSGLMLSIVLEKQTPGLDLTTLKISFISTIFLSLVLMWLNNNSATIS